MTLIPPLLLYGTSYTIHSPTNFCGQLLQPHRPLGSILQIRWMASDPAGQFTAIGSEAAMPRTHRRSGRPAHFLSLFSRSLGVIAYGWNAYDAYSYPAGLYCMSSAGAPPVNFTCPPSNVVASWCDLHRCRAQSNRPVGNAGAALSSINRRWLALSSAGQLPDHHHDH